MKHTRIFLPLVPVLSLVLACMVVPSAQAAFLPGTTSVTAGNSVPLLVPSTAPTGTLQAGVINPAFQIKNAQNIVVSSGSIASAVYKNPSGTLDFYYQVTNNPSSPANCGTTSGICDAVTRETNFNFLTVLPEWLTAVGFRVDGGGAFLPGFVSGTVGPFSGDRSANGATVGFTFSPGGSPIAPGQQSLVLVISTDATNFTQGASNVIDGGVGSVVTYQPAPTVGTPEPASIALLGGGLLALAGIRRFRRS